MTKIPVVVEDEAPEPTPYDIEGATLQQTEFPFARGCNTSPYYSRACGRGTKGCIVDHEYLEGK